MTKTMIIIVVVSKHQKGDKRYANDKGGENRRTKPAKPTRSMFFLGRDQHETLNYSRLKLDRELLAS